MFTRSLWKCLYLGVPFGAINNNIELFVRVAKILNLGISALLLGVLRLKRYVTGYLSGCFRVCLELLYYAWLEIVEEDGGVVVEGLG